MQQIEKVRERATYHAVHRSLANGGYLSICVYAASSRAQRPMCRHSVRASSPANRQRAVSGASASIVIYITRRNRKFLIRLSGGMSRKCSLVIQKQYKYTITASAQRPITQRAIESAIILPNLLRHPSNFDRCILSLYIF